MDEEFVATSTVVVRSGRFRFSRIRVYHTVRKVYYRTVLYLTVLTSDGGHQTVHLAQHLTSLVVEKLCSYS